MNSGSCTDRSCDPADERRAAQLDRDRQHRVEREQHRQRQQHRHAAARRVDAALLVERHHLGVHLLPRRIGHLQLRVAILDRLDLGLDLLHLPHRDDALVAQREHRQVDEDRQQDDRPAVVADVAVDPLQRAQQRHDEPARTCRSRSRAPDRDRPRRARRSPSGRRRMPRRSAAPLNSIDHETYGGGGSSAPCVRRHRPPVSKCSATGSGSADGRGQEVVIVDAGESESALRGRRPRRSSATLTRSTSPSR